MEQIYKQFLTNKVLSDPRQKRFFKPKNIRDLFKLTDGIGEGTETGDIFSGTRAKEITGSNKDPDESKELSANGNVEENDDSKEGGNAGLLNSLLDDSENGQLHSTINHDAVLGAGTDGKDVTLMKYEADKVAKEAMEELSRSSLRRRRQGVAVPTWTGKSGLAGYFNRGSSSTEGTSKAASLLQKMRQREGGARFGTNKELSKNSALLQDIIDFLKDHGGQSTSGDVVDHFRDRVEETSEGLQEFKSLLKKVACLKKGKGPSGAAIWQLNV